MEGGGQAPAEGPPTLGAGDRDRTCTPSYGNQALKAARLPPLCSAARRQSRCSQLQFVSSHQISPPLAWMWRAPLAQTPDVRTHLDETVTGRLLLLSEAGLASLRTAGLRLGRLHRRGQRPLHLAPSRPDKMQHMRPGTDTRVRSTWYRIQPVRMALQLSGGDWIDQPPMSLLVRKLVDRVIAITTA